MKSNSAVVVLCLLSLGHAAPLSDCDALVKPITISKEELLGQWLYIGGSSDIPGSRSLARLMSNVWVNISATGQDNILTIDQTQKVLDDCSSFKYNVTFESSTMLIEEPFYLKEVYFPTDCPTCLAIHEKVVSGEDTFTSLLLFGRTQNASAADVQKLKRQAECLQMPPPRFLQTDEVPCPHNSTTIGGLEDLNMIFDAKMILKILDSVFDIFSID